MGEAPVRSKLLNAVVATGPGNPVIFQSTRSDHSFQVILTGSPTAAIVTLEGSLDGGTTWGTLATWDLSAPQVSGDVITAGNAGVGAVRANCTTLSGGSSPTVTAEYVGKR